MTLQSNGTPTLVSTAGSNAPSVTGTFPTGSSPLVGHLIVVVISLYGSTAATSVSPAAGYTVAKSNTATNCLSAVYTKTATGSDSAPVFTGVTTGTAADGDMTITVYDISDPVNGNTPIVDASGTATGTTALGACTTTGTLIASGELAVVVSTIGQGTTTNPNTWTTPTNWTLPQANCAQTATSFSQTANYFTTNGTVLASGSTATVTTVKTRVTTRTSQTIVTFAPVQTFGPALAPLSQPAGSRSCWARTGIATASLIPLVVALPPNTTAPIPLHQPVHAPYKAVPKGRTYSNAGVRNQTGPAAIPLHQPVRPRVLVTFSKGRAYGISGAGVRNQTGPPFPPLHSPVAQGNANVPTRNGAGLGRRGVTQSRAGVFNQLGPAVTPLHRPVAPTRVLPPKGRSYTRSQPFQGLGPAVTPLHRPVSAIVRVLPKRGTAQGNKGTFTPTTPAVVYPLTRPVTAIVRVLPRRGVAYSRAGVFNQLGPQVKPLTQPVTARVRVLPSRGRVVSSPGTRGQTGPQVTALFRPVAAVVRPLPRRGVTYSRAGVFGQLGPQVTPLTRPVQARPPLPRRGRVYATPLTTQVVVPVPATFYAFRQPVRARPAALLTGRAMTMAAIPITNVNFAIVYPLRQPVRARVLPLRQGRVCKTVISAPTPPVNVTAVYPFRQPVRAKVPPPLRGRAYTRTGVFGQTGVLFPALHQPVRARPPLPPKGRTYGNKGAPVVNPTIATVRPLTAPVRGRAAPQLTGRAMTMGVLQLPTPGPTTPATFYPIHSPVRARIARATKGGYGYGRSSVVIGIGVPLLPLSQPPGGRVFYERTGYGQGTVAGPPTPPVNRTVAYPIHAPVRARPPLPPRGRALSTPPYVAPFVNTTKAIPLHSPVKARPPLPPRGRSYKNVRVNPVPNSTILFPLHAPVKARPPLPPHGRAYTTSPYVPPFVPPGGHGYPYDAKLVPARWSAFLVDGEWAGSQKAPVRYYAIAVDSRWPSKPIAGRWFGISGPA